MEEEQESRVFKAMVGRILEDATFAQALLEGEPDYQKEALYGFLDEMDFQGEKAEALDHLNAVLDHTDLERIAALGKTLDGPVSIPF
jgi:hypothetical protein